MEKENIVIVAGCRTAVGSMGGSLKDFEASDLGGIVIKEAVKRSGLKPEDIDEVVFGCVGQAAENAFAARLSGIKAGLPVETTALTVNRLCSSGLQAIVTASQEIRDGMCEIAVAGGCESMTNIPFYLRKARFGYRMGNGKLEDGLVTAISDPFTGNHMGWTAENVAAEYHVTREEQDRWALISQQRAAAARAAGLFKDEIVPIEVKVGKKETKIFDEDEYIRANASMESLAKLKAVFVENGTVTAGNASGINDAAAAVVVMTETKAKELGLKPIVRGGCGCRRCGPEDHGHWTDPGLQEAAEEDRRKEGRNRPDRVERGFCLPGSCMHPGAGTGREHCQCQRQRHFHGPSHRCHRLHHHCEADE